LSGAHAVFAAGSEPGRLVSVMQPETDQPVRVIFIGADGVPLRDAFRLPTNYSVSAASTVKAAAALSRGHPFDLVILDLGPSALAGLQMLRILKADPRLGMAAVVLVGNFEDMWAIRLGLHLGARDYLISGETTPALVARRLRSWLDEPTRRALRRRASRVSPAAYAPAVPAAVPAARTSLAAHFGGPAAGLAMLLLKQTRFLVMGRGTTRP
jgi:CheY-like chemotaxis protein